MTFARVNPIGWALFELLTSAQMNQLDINMTNALDGAAGGTYTPNPGLVIDGAATVGTAALTVIAPTAQVGLQVLADVGSSTAALRVQLDTIDRAGLIVSPIGTLSQAGKPGVMTTIIAHDNDTGPGGDGITTFGADGGASDSAGGIGLNAFGGDGGGTTGEGSDGITALGGDAAGSPARGGRGVFGAGGVPGGGVDVTASAGVYGLGGTTGAGVLGGAGVVGQGGDSGTPALAGHGGDFTGGNGGHGIRATGGSSSGIGGEFFATGIASGVKATGAGTASALIATADSGDNAFGAAILGAGNKPALLLEKGASAVAAIDTDGPIDFDSGLAADVNPAATVAALNKLYGKNVVKAWGFVEDGVLTEGFNITSVAINGTSNQLLDVTLAEDMADANYCIMCTDVTYGAGANPRSYSPQISVVLGGAVAPTAGAFQIHQRGAVSDTSENWNDSHCYFFVIGQQ